MYSSVWPAGRSTRSGVFVVSVSFLLFSFGMSFVGNALAQESPDDERLTILITASRITETVDETLAPVTVITRAEIEEKQARTVAEALRAVPGVSFSNSGGPGKLTSLFLRGTESNHVLVLIDGVKVGNATAGSTPFEHLPVDQIEKIEVVRGPRSSLYGSEAIGGVIQIFTRKGAGKPRPRFSASLGGHAAGKMNLGVSGGAGDAWYNLGTATEFTKGFNSCRGSQDPFAGCFLKEDALEKDDDGHENQSVSLRGGVAVTDSFSVEGNFLNSESETEFDGGIFSGNESETVTRLASVKLNFQADEQLHTSLLVSRSQDQADNFKDGAFVSTFDTTRNQIAWQNNIRVNENTRLILGADYLDDKVSGTTNYEVRSRDNFGVFGSWRTAVNDNDLELSLRDDHNEQFGEATTGGIGWGRDLGDGERITASYGTAFSVPTFNDLYFPGSGNPNLKPEKSKSIDFGFSQTKNNATMAINFYHTIIDDLIANDSAFIPRNISKAKITGAEISATVRSGAWDLGVNTTVQKPRDASGGANDGNTLARRAKATMDIDIAGPLGEHRVGANLFIRGKSYDDAANTIPISGFATLNLRAETRLTRHWLAALKINNLFDKEHETARFYPQDGRNFLATLRYIP